MTEPSPREPRVQPPPPRPHTMRRPRRIDFALQRIRENWVLKGSVVLSFVCYGGLLALSLAGRMPYLLGGMIAFMSLATWFFILWWYPVLEQTIRATESIPGRAWIGRALEAFAIGCAALVHILMAVMIVVRARS